MVEKSKLKGEGKGDKGRNEGEVRWEKRGIRQYLTEVDEEVRMKYMGNEGRGVMLM